MPMTIDQNLVPSAIVEFHAAKDSGRDDAAAWSAAVKRVRYDVLRMAAMICEAQSAHFVTGSPEAEACHACFRAIRDYYPDDADTAR